MSASCSSYVPKEGDIIEDSAFYAVDLLEIEKLKGEEMLFSDLIESLEIIKQLYFNRAGWRFCFEIIYS